MKVKKEVIKENKVQFDIFLCNVNVDVHDSSINPGFVFFKL